MRRSPETAFEPMLLTFFSASCNFPVLSKTFNEMNYMKCISQPISYKTITDLLPQSKTSLVLIVNITEGRSTTIATLSDIWPQKSWFLFSKKWFEFKKTVSRVCQRETLEADQQFCQKERSKAVWWWGNIFFVTIQGCELIGVKKISKRVLENENIFE